MIERGVFVECTFTQSSLCKVVFRQMVEPFELVGIFTDGRVTRYSNNTAADTHHFTAHKRSGNLKQYWILPSEDAPPESTTIEFVGGNAACYAAECDITTPGTTVAQEWYGTFPDIYTMERFASTIGETLAIPPTLFANIARDPFTYRPDSIIDPTHTCGCSVESSPGTELILSVYVKMPIASIREMQLVTDNRFFQAVDAALGY